MVLIALFIITLPATGRYIQMDFNSIANAIPSPATGWHYYFLLSDQMLKLGPIKIGSFHQRFSAGFHASGQTAGF